MSGAGLALDAPGLFRRPTWFDVGVTLSAVLLLIVEVVHHEMWHDEINAFEIALHSPTLRLLFSNLHYEGHPSLWYLMLWFTSAFSTAPESAQTVHTVIVILVYAMVGLFSPFSLLERVLLLTGYFLSFEYAVLARNYSLGVLFALLYAELRSKRPNFIMLNSAVLGLLANTTVFGLILSGALACEYVVDRLRFALRSGAPRMSSIAAGAAVYCAFVAFSVFTIMPAQDIGAHGSKALFEHMFEFWHFRLAVVNAISLPFIPIHGDFPAHYWIGSADAMLTLWKSRQIALPFVVLGLFCIFRRDMRLLFIIAVTGAATVLFGHLIYTTAIRHTGIFFVAVLAALWIQRVERPTGMNRLVVALLLCGSVGGTEAHIGQWMRPFSNSRVAAQWLNDNGLRDAGLIGAPDDWAIPVAEHLGRPMLGLSCLCIQDFLKFDSSHETYGKVPFIEVLPAAVSEVQSQPPILVFANPRRGLDTNGLERRGLRAILIAEFAGSESGEDYQIYKFAPVP